MKRLTDNQRQGCRACNVVALVLVAIVGMVAFIFVFGGPRPDDFGRRSRCRNNQKQLALALLMYESKHGYFPGYSNVDANGTRLGWYAPLLPYLGRNDLELGSIHSESQGVYLSVAVCPSDRPENPIPGYNNYVVNCGQPDASVGPDTPPDWKANGVFFDHGTDPSNVVKMDSEYIQMNDGMSMTMMLTENIDAGPWTSANEPRIGVVYSTKGFGDLSSDQPLIHDINQYRGESDGSYRFARPSSYHPGGFVMTLCDGSQRYFAQNPEADRVILALLMTPNGQSSRRAGTDVVVPVLANSFLGEDDF